MFELTCALTLVLVVGGALYAFDSTRDPLHPAVFVAPMFGYFYGLWPILLNQNDGLQTILSTDALEHAAIIFLLSIAAMYMGLLYGNARLKNAPPPNLNPFGEALSRNMSRRLLYLALFMGILSVGAFAIQIDAVGGLIRAYSYGKGGGHAVSGYIGEASLLSFPALLILALSVYAAGRRIRILHIVTALFIASPHLIHGILGGRRGPLFLILSTLFFSWFLARGKRPRLATALSAVVAIGFGVILVGSQRHYLYLGSEKSFEFSRVFERGDGIAPREIELSGNSYVTAVANIAASDYYQDYYWGYRYFVTFVIRPIPRQIWPTKYEDMGATWLTVNGDSSSRFLNVVGFVLPAGVSGGSIADGYTEFAWWIILLFFFFGRAFGTVYALHRREGGFWSVIFFTMLALSIYLPSQSVSAWLVRFLFMSIFAYLFWRMAMGPITNPRLRQAVPPRLLYRRRV